MVRISSLLGHATPRSHQEEMSRILPVAEIILNDIQRLIISEARGTELRVGTGIGRNIGDIQRAQRRISISPILLGTDEISRQARILQQDFDLVEVRKGFVKLTGRGRDLARNLRG